MMEVAYLTRDMSHALSSTKLVAGLTICATSDLTLI